MGERERASEQRDLTQPQESIASSSSSSSFRTSNCISVDERLHFDLTPSSRKPSSSPPKRKKRFFYFSIGKKTPTNQRKWRRQKEQAKKRLPTPWRRSARRCSR